MVNYTCPRCGYNINNITKYQKHLRRKKICENILSDDNLFNEYIKFNITEKLDNVHFNLKSLNSTETRQKTPKPAKIGKIPTKYRQKPPEYRQKPPEYEEYEEYDGYSDESSENEKSYKCKYCDKIFTRKDSLTRHIKNRCKEKYEIDEDEKNELKKMMEIVDKLNEKLDKKDEQISELIKKSGNTTINYQQNNSVNNNIKLLGYRKTDISHLSDKDFISCISHSNFCIPHLIQKIHFDPDKPENHNIYISNIKNNYAMIYDGDKWNLTNRDDLVEEILEEKEIIIEEKLEEWLEKGRQYPEIMKKFTRYLEKKEHDVVLDKIKDEIKLVLFNNRNLIKNS